MWYAWNTCVNNFTLQSRFTFLHHCDVSFVMSKLLYQCFCYNNTFNVISWYVQVTHKSYIVITFFLGLSLWDTLHFVTTTFSRFMQNVFLITLEMRRLLVCPSYVRKHMRIGPHIWITFLWYVCIPCWSNVAATFRFRLSLSHTFIMSQLPYLFVQRGTLLMMPEPRWIIEIVGTLELYMEVTL